ncbi:semaphorin-3C, partial [Tachysurus ichikawai]
LQTSHSFEFYTLSEKQMDYRILYVDEDQDRMYVGCKDHLLSMDINNITQGTLKVRRRFIGLHPTLRLKNVRWLEKIQL